ncbi:protein of unknown function [uncultured Sphingopyxis sp.]|uniref:Uncharacterized protein n=1 Tax=uncultured Sphingopyxis sp. TaxID=310581 RepID=A0A1Y5PSK4_9SPHN|nr:protein of unknown function [uncultured Sphingopyxis sp.]
MRMSGRGFAQFYSELVKLVIPLGYNDTRERAGSRREVQCGRAASGHGGAKLCVRDNVGQRFFEPVHDGGIGVGSGQTQSFVIPAKAGTQSGVSLRMLWVPAFAGMTK